MKKALWTTIDWTLFFLAYFSALCTIATTYMGADYFQVRTAIVSIAGVILIFTFYGYKIVKIKNSFKCKAEEVTKKFHEICHNMRDERYNIIKSYENKSLTQKLLDSNFERIMVTSVNSISDILTQLTGEKVSVSIKYFESDGSDISNATVRNLISCKNTDKDRINGNQRNRISSITEYRELMFGDRTFYHNRDLFKDNDYTYPLDWRKYYRTKMVFPIRIIEEKTHDGLVKYQVLGFICADSKKADCFYNDLTMYENLVFGIADNMYSCFYDYQYYSKLLENRQREDDTHETQGVV